MWSCPMYRVVADTFRLPGDEAIVRAVSAAALTTQRSLRCNTIDSTSYVVSGFGRTFHQKFSWNTTFANRALTISCGRCQLSNASLSPSTALELNAL